MEYSELKKWKLVSQVTLLRHPKFASAEAPAVINSSKDAIDFFRVICEENLIAEEEASYMLLLDKHYVLLGYQALTKGKCTGNRIDVKVIFTGALLADAKYILIAYSKPALPNKLSFYDMQLVGQIISASRIFSIRLLDYIILSKETHYSYQKNNLIYD